MSQHNSYIKQNLFDALAEISPPHIGEEIVDILAGSDSVRIERIISRGHASEESHWYDQDSNEWVMVAQGEARLQFSDGSIMHMKAGDHIVIPAHQKHRVDWTSPKCATVWLAVFY